MSNWVNRYPNRRRTIEPEKRMVDGEELLVLRGTIRKMETRSVFVAGQGRAEPESETINGMPRANSVVVYIRPSQDEEYYGIDCRKEVWNSQWDEATAKYGDFAEGDSVEILINDANIPVSITKI